MRYRQLLIILIGWVFTAQAQQTQQIPMGELVDHFAAKENISIAYDPQILQFSSVNVDTASLTLDAFERLLSEKYPFALEQISEGIWILKPRIFPFELHLQGFEEESNDAFARLSVNRKIITSEWSEEVLHFEYQPKLGDTLLLNVIGYEDTYLLVEDLLSMSKKTVSLIPLQMELAGITIMDFITKGININPSNQKITIQTNQLPLLPGETDGDLFASLSSIPGISTPDNRAGNLFIRGSSTDQTYVLYDNIPIYHRGHYFGTISPYNARVVDEVEVNRGGFHPRLGGRVGGAVNIQSSDATDAEKNIGLGANTLYSMAFAKIPNQDSVLGLTFGARKSYPIGIKSPKLNSISEAVFDASAAEDANGDVTETLDVTFQDYQLSLDIQPSSKTTFKLTGIYTNSFTTYELAQGNIESSEFDNYGMNVSMHHRLNERWESQLDITLSDYHLDFATQLVGGTNVRRRDPTSVNDLRDIKWKWETGYEANNGNQLQFGVEYLNQKVAIEYLNYGQTVNNQPPPINEYRSEETANTIAIFANHEWLNHSRWYIQFGSRLDYYVPLSQWQFSPRVFTSYDLFNPLTLKASVGRYYQVLSQIQDIEFSSGGFTNQVWMLAGSQSGHVIQSDQWMAGAIFSSGKWLIDFELYEKYNYDVTYASTIRINDRTAFFEADQVYKGFDLTIKKGWWSDITSWIGYSYLDGSITIKSPGYGTYEDKYVQPHVLFTGLSYARDRFKFSAGWKWASGLSTNTFEMARLSKIFEQNPTLNPAEDPTRGLADRYDPIHMLDASFSYVLPKADKRPFKSTVGFSVINTYNADNLTDQVFRLEGSSQQGLNNRYAIGFAPNLMLTIEW
jgi:hypothetical protein